MLEEPRDRQPCQVNVGHHDLLAGRIGNLAVLERLLQRPEQVVLDLVDRDTEPERDPAAVAEHGQIASGHVLEEQRGPGTVGRQQRGELIPEVHGSGDAPQLARVLQYREKAAK